MPTKTRDFAAVVRQRLATDVKLAQAVDREAINANIATQIHEAREQAGLTQQQLAKRAQTHQSVIARLEDADYEGHSISMLNRIAAALGMSLTVAIAPKAGPIHAARKSSTDAKPGRRDTRGKTATKAGSRKQKIKTASAKQ
jgi:ribosome-binding protein aMBF1 (putative translation factor)